MAGPQVENPIPSLTGPQVRAGDDGINEQIVRLGENIAHVGTIFNYLQFMERLTNRTKNQLYSRCDLSLVYRESQVRQ